jgi:hypothetical protein
MSFEPTKVVFFCRSGTWSSTFCSQFKQATRDAGCEKDFSASITTLSNPWKSDVCAADHVVVVSLPSSLTLDDVSEHLKTHNSNAVTHDFTYAHPYEKKHGMIF